RCWPAAMSSTICASSAANTTRTRSTARVGAVRECASRASENRGSWAAARLGRREQWGQVLR
ncbi:MAG TPA: hypothetical protein VGP82_12455, partial [Ktedonobacterales bacterium]|nr:hypothetical protein [Ktedonobacterales bacterium]